MTIACFLQIRSAFHTESGESSVCDKLHKLRYLIRSTDDVASNTFDLVPTADLYEVGIATYSRFCCVRQYNKDKPDKFCINLFVLANSTH